MIPRSSLTVQGCTAYGRLSKLRRIDAKFLMLQQSGHRRRAFLSLRDSKLPPLFLTVCARVAYTKKFETGRRKG
jgi:hypothetical protein